MKMNEARLKRRAADLDVKIWRGYDLDFKHNWVVEFDNKEHIYLDYTESALEAFIVAIERDDKLRRLGI